MLSRVDPEDRIGAVRLHLACLAPRPRQLVLAAAGGRPAVVARDDLGDLAARGAPAEALARLREVSAAQAVEAIDRSVEDGLRLAFPWEAGWPRLLHRLPDPPLALWVRGELPPPDAVAVAVVGSRRPTAYGLSRARRLAADLARCGAVVVSGGARGVDGAAHRAALEAGAGTVAVLGCGVDVDYPAEHAALFGAVAAAGAVVSELPPGTPPRPAHFPARNRLLAGWSVAVLVVEAAARSGTLITARLALELDRSVLAVPGPVTSELSAGTNALIREGAVLVRDVDDVLAELPPGLVRSPPRDEGPPDSVFDPRTDLLRDRQVHLSGEVRDRNAPDLGVRPSQHLRVPVLPQHVSVDGMRRHSQVLSEETPEAGRVQDGAAPDDLAGRQP